MEVDALNSSHPVSTPVENPAQIREMFDDVSYDKVQVDWVKGYSLDTKVIHAGVEKL